MALESLEPSNSIVASHVSRFVRGRTLLKGVTLQIFPGEVFGIFGRSGCGKTALLRTLAGLDQPDAGRVMIQAAEDDQSDWIDAVPAVALQTPGLVQDVSAYENMQFFARLWGLPRRRRSTRIAKCLEMLDLSEVRNRRVRDLPHGARIRLELARALLPESLIVMIDGLLETLQPDVRLRVWEHIKARVRAGAACIIATASPREAENCDRIAVLERGSVEFVGAPEELVRHMGPETVIVQSVRTPLVGQKIREKLCVTVEERDGGLLFTTSEGQKAVREILSEFSSDVSAVYLRRPGLAEVLDKLT